MFAQASHLVVAVSTLLSHTSSTTHAIILYFGPETILPLASIIAAMIGVILMFWRVILAAIRKGIRIVLRRPEPEPVEGLDDLADIDLGITTASGESAPASQEARN